jgi:glycosyltransferase involved in cell wall biosynthesis
MIQDAPLVSVLMTAYNREKFIAEAIESVLASTYKNFELIIVDDCSTDATVSIARQYAAVDRRVSVQLNEKNMGQFPNRNRAASFASGKYIKYLDSDDKLLDFGLAYCVEQMEKYPEAGMGMFSLYSPEGSNAQCLSSKQIVREHFFKSTHLSIGPSGTIVRRDRFMASGCYDSRFGVPSDMYFNIRFASLHPVVLLPVAFFYYREHEGQEINNRMDYLTFGYLYLKELLEKVPLPLSKKEIQYLYGKMMKRHAVNLARYCWQTKSLKAMTAVMKETKFSKNDFLIALFK